MIFRALYPLKTLPRATEQTPELQTCHPSFLIGWLSLDTNNSRIKVSYKASRDVQERAPPKQTWTHIMSGDVFLEEGCSRERREGCNDQVQFLFQVNTTLKGSIETSCVLHSLSVVNLKQRAHVSVLDLATLRTKLKFKLQKYRSTLNHSMNYRNAVWATH